MNITHANGGIEIDAGNADLSANVYSGMIEIAIGENFSNRGGYERYLDFSLSPEDARTFLLWLSSALDRISGTDADAGAT